MNKDSLSRRNVLFGTLLVVIAFIGLLWRFLPTSREQDAFISSTHHHTPKSQTVSDTTSPDSTVAATSVATQPVQDKLLAISPEMAAEIRRLSNHRTDDLAQTTHPDGSVTIDMQDHFQSVLVGVRDANGNIVIGHGEEFLQNVSAQ